MSWQPLSNNGAFVPNAGYQGGPLTSDQFLSWEQPANIGGGDIGSLMEQRQLAAWDAGILRDNAQAELAGRMGAAPSKWATGAQTFGSVAQGLAGLGNIYLGLQGMKQQKRAFEFNKGVTNTNLNNSIMDYNRRLSDTLTNRSLNNGQGQGWVSDQLSKYSAKRSG